MTTAAFAAARRRFISGDFFSRHFHSLYVLSSNASPLLELASLPTRSQLVFGSPRPSHFRPLRQFCSDRTTKQMDRAEGDTSEDCDDDDDEDKEVDDDDDDVEDDIDEGKTPDKTISANEVASKKLYGNSGKSDEQKAEEALKIGYKVVGRLDPKEEDPFKPYEPVFSIIQLGSHQFKVSNGDSIFTERLKYCDVNDKLILSKVLMLGSTSQTMIGRPTLPHAAVHAIVEEHALDAKVIIFKKKRRKNYRRTKGHRQELTKLRITDIEGIDKVQNENVAVSV